MPKPRPPARPLSADRLAAWRLSRQLLGPATAAPDPEAVATTLVGVQAQVASAAALSIALRTSDGRVVDTSDALTARRLVRAWAMRGTLHLFAADDYPTIVAALRRRETWRRPVWFRYFEVTEAEMEAIIEGVGAVLDDGRPRTRAELSHDLGKHVGRGLGSQLASSWGTLLKPAAERGYLIHASGEGSGVTFTRPDRWIGRWRDEDPDEALVTVLRRYLRAYGPASEKEILRWWGGLKPSFIRPALAALAAEITEVEVGRERGLLLTADLAEIEATAPLDGRVELLGPFDPLIVGAGARGALIPAEHYARVSRTAGWISPVVLVGGVVAGVWDSRQRGGSLEITVDCFKRTSPVLRRAIGAAVERVAAAQGATADVAFGPVFAARAAAGESDRSAGPAGPGRGRR
jgi:hypothetical protein